MFGFSGELFFALRNIEVLDLSCLACWGEVGPRLVATEAPAPVAVIWVRLVFFLPPLVSCFLLPCFTYDEDSFRKGVREDLGGGLDYDYYNSEVFLLVIILLDRSSSLFSSFFDPE